MIMTRTALVLGITGGIGGATARALLARGWHVRALHREPARAKASAPSGVEWLAGDALDRQAVLQAASGAAVIVHAVNPPGYRNWRGLAVPMLERTIDAARASGARILFPGNVYNFGPDAGSTIAENAPQNPLTRKGRIRVAMEARLEAAAAEGVRSLVLRAGDYFGAGGAWFDGVMVKRGRPPRSVTYPGEPRVGHAWAYLPDLAETFARLAERETELGAFERFHFGGHYLAEGIEMAETILRAAGSPDGRIRRLPWALLRLASPFHETCRELLEMRYLWRAPLQLDNRKLLAVLGEEPHTPLEQAVTESLLALGCLPKDAAYRSAASA
ncbi:NAD-dependent epimerase/dehydratase family protein [Denitratimonas tolerans]|uniref:NAD-dependent epimerase/dehydratase family protein n=1 Tax=Denitratimonas tolerans TaxID=1338420 RepID=A0AAW9RBW6_9GAMM